MDPTDLPHVMTVDEIARFLRVHRSTIYRLIKSHSLPGVFRVGCDWRITQEALERWITGQQPDSQPATGADHARPNRPVRDVAG